LVTLEEIRDNTPRPLEVPSLGIVVMIRDVTDGERTDIATEVEKKRKQKIAERYAEMKKDNIIDTDFIKNEIEAINDWAVNEATRLTVFKMIVEPDLSTEENRRSIPRKTLDTIFLAVLEELNREAQDMFNLKQEVKKS